MSRELCWSRRPLCLKRVLLLLFCWSAYGTSSFSVAQASLIPAFALGHYYTPTDDGIVVEWDAALNEIRRFTVPDVRTTSGAVFNERGNLVIVCQMGVTGRTHILEVDATGMIQKNYDTGLSGFLRGSYIDFNRRHGVYAVAVDEKVLFLNSDLTFRATSAPIFERASGVTMQPDGTTYATDQFRNFIHVFDVDGNTLDSIFFPSHVAVGLDFFEPDQLFVGLFGAGQLDRYSLFSGVRTPVVTGLGNGGISDVHVLPNGNLLTIDFRNQIKLFDASGELLDANVSTGRFSDGIAVFVPEPSSIFLTLTGLAGVILLPRRRPSRALCKNCAPAFWRFNG